MRIRMACMMLALSACLVAAQNLIRNGSFDGEAGVAEYRPNGGKFSVFTEELTWNRCGRLTLDRVLERGEERVHNAALWMGAEGVLPGFAAAPETRYQFSLEVRGDVAGPASISAICWHGDDIWKDYKSVRTTVESFTVQPGWTVYRGTLTTLPGTRRLALQLQMWESSKHGPLRYKVGDSLLFDNLEVTAAPQVLGGAAPALPAVPLRKAIRTEPVSEPIAVDGELREAAWQRAPEMSDFFRLGSEEPAGAATTVRILSDAEHLYLGIRCSEPGQVVAEQGEGSRNLWRDDVLEIFFGAVSSDRQLSQFVISAGGGRFLGYGNDSTLPVDGASWEGRTSRGDGYWQAELRIPTRLLSQDGQFALGDMLPFNVARQRRSANELSTWSRLQESFHEVAHYGVLVLGDYSAALARLSGDAAAAAADGAAFARALQGLAEATLRAKYAAAAGRKFAVAPVSVTANFAIPFIPEEIFAPPAEIRVTAAVNELKGVPLALANLTERPAEYQVILETCGRYNGAFGLEGFPGSQITMRQAVRFKDSDADSGSLRLDPLPRMNQASTLMVLPKEAGLVWIDFNTAGVAPGLYSGRLRVIPLSEPAKWEKIKGAYWDRQYTGDMQDIPFTLEVLDLVLDPEPALPMGFFQSADNESCFRLMYEAGTRNIGLSPWSFLFPRTAAGDLDAEGSSPVLDEVLATVRRHEAWAGQYQTRLTYFIGFSAYHAFQQVYGVTRKAEECERLWPQWIKAVGTAMARAGVDTGRFVIETWDEPHPDKFSELMLSHRLAKASAPAVRLSLTLGAHIMPADKMAELAPQTDEWTLWSDGYFKHAEHVQLLKSLQARGVAIRHYTCDTSMRSSLARRYRRNAWFGEFHGLDGNEMFQFADTYGGRGASDWKVCTEGGIVYKLFDEYMPSLRYMALRQGMTDIKYLARLRQLAPGHPEAEAFLAQAARRVVVDFGHDPTYPDRVREEATALILKLQRAAARP